MPDAANASARSIRSRPSALPPAPWVRTRPSFEGDGGRCRKPRTAGRVADVALNGSAS